MKIFIGQPVTGEDINQLREESDKICSLLESKNKETYCVIFDGSEKEANSNENKMKYAFSKLDGCDTFLVILRNERKSEGMLMEFGYAIAKKMKIIVAIKNGVKNTYLPEIADEVIKFENIDDLLNKLKELK